MGKFLIKTQGIALCFYLDLKNEPWFGPDGSENAENAACVNGMLQHAFTHAFNACSCVFRVEIAQFCCFQ